MEQTQLTSKDGKDCGWQGTDDDGEEWVKQDTMEQFENYLVNIWSGEDFSTTPEYPAFDDILKQWEAQTAASWEEVQGKWWLTAGTRGLTLKD